MLIIIILVEMTGFESRQIDDVLDFSQAPIDSDAYLHLLAGFHVDGTNENEIYFLQLDKIYIELAKHQKIGLIY